MNVISNNPIKCTIALAALESVVDPEIGLNVVDLGMVLQIDFLEEEKRIICRMTLTTQFCPMGESISNAVRARLENTFSEYNIEVNISFDIPWTHDRISPEGKEFLNR